MQLCSPLKKKCNNQDGYAICLIKNNTEKGIGNIAKNLYLIHCVMNLKVIDFIYIYRKIPSESRE